MKKFHKGSRRNGQQVEFDVKRTNFNIVRQTHASFIDSMLMKARLNDLDRADELRKQLHE